MTAPAQTSEQRLAQRAMIRLLMGYLPVLPPDLRAAVLAARAAVSQVGKNARAGFQSRTKNHGESVAGENS